MTPIDAKILHAWQVERRNFTLLDTLPAAAYDKGHLPGAVNIVSDEILDLAPSRLPDKNQVIVVYCASIDCKRAGLSVERLESLGYVQIHHFMGGKREWTATGLPLQTTERSDAG